jgi:glycosyltransferase involved in cell wall biosynthesis
MSQQISPSDPAGSHERPFRLAVLNSHPIQYFAPLYRRLAALPGMDLTVYYCSRQSTTGGLEDPGFGREVVWDVPLLEGYRYRFLRNVGGDRGVRGFLSLTNLEVVAALRRGRYDALIVHGHAHFTVLLAIAAARMLGTAVFMRGESNLMLASTPFRRAARGLLLRGLYRACNAFLYIGRLNREFYLHHGVPADRLFFVPYTVDNERFARGREARNAEAASLRQALGIAPQAIVVLYASKLIARKRPLDLLEVHRRLQATDHPTELLIVGDGPLLAEFRCPVESESIPRVHIAGFRNQAELPVFYAAADVMVLPSDDEPWGLVVNEAMAVGVPVIATDRVGAAADLIRDGETGFTYRVGDVDALVRHLAAIASDAKLRSRMSENCVRVMKEWSYDQCIIGICEALSATLNRSAERVPGLAAP